MGGGGLKETSTVSLKEDSQIDFVLYAVILTLCVWGGDPDMMFFNFFIMSKSGKCWPIRNCAFIIISRQLQYKCSHKVYAHTCSNPPGMYIKVVMNLFFYIVLFAKILILEFIGLHPYMCQVGSQE